MLRVPFPTRIYSHFTSSNETQRLGSEKLAQTHAMNKKRTFSHFCLAQHTESVLWETAIMHKVVRQKYWK